MGSNSLSRLGRNHRHRQRTKQEVNPIVDDPKSSNPQSLLPWLKRQLQRTIPITTQHSPQQLRLSSFITR